MTLTWYARIGRLKHSVQPSSGASAALGMCQMSRTRCRPNQRERQQSKQVGKLRLLPPMNRCLHFPPSKEQAAKRTTSAISPMSSTPSSSAKSARSATAFGPPPPPRKREGFGRDTSPPMMTRERGRKKQTPPPKVPSHGSGRSLVQKRGKPSSLFLILGSLCDGVPPRTHQNTTA